MLISFSTVIFNPSQVFLSLQPVSIARERSHAEASGLRVTARVALHCCQFSGKQCEPQCKVVLIYT